jgi:hypothetical protein
MDWLTLSFSLTYIVQSCFSDHFISWQTLCLLIFFLLSDEYIVSLIFIFQYKQVYIFILTWVVDTIVSCTLTSLFFPFSQALFPSSFFSFTRHVVFVQLAWYPYLVSTSSPSSLSSSPTSRGFSSPDFYLGAASEVWRFPSRKSLVRLGILVNTCLAIKQCRSVVLCVPFIACLTCKWLSPSLMFLSTWVNMVELIF